MPGEIEYSLVARGTTVLAEYRHASAAPRSLLHRHRPVAPAPAQPSGLPLRWLWALPVPLARARLTRCWGAPRSCVGGNANLVANRILEKLPSVDRCGKSAPCAPGVGPHGTGTLVHGAPGG